MRRRQKLVAITSAVIGLSLVILLGPFLYESLCRIRFAENVILREKPKNLWRRAEHRRGVSEEEKSTAEECQIEPFRWWWGTGNWRRGSIALYAGRRVLLGRRFEGAPIS